MILDSNDGAMNAIPVAAPARSIDLSYSNLRPGNLLKLAYRTIRISGTELRMRVAPLLGDASFYDLPAGYRHRAETSYFDDLENSDEWQREVYEAARAIIIENQLRTVHDVGCGSGYKLVHILGQFDTTGVDLPETIDRVKQLYPGRKWIPGPFDKVELPKADMVICADVIEHVADPDALMRFLVRSSRDRVILSTPDRDKVYPWWSLSRFGPPANPAHVREWTMPEFRRYVGRYLEIESHEISNSEQATQMIVGRVCEGA